MNRNETLQTAREAVRDRGQQYGSPRENFQQAADLWTAYLQGSQTITAQDVAVLQILFKVSRVSANPAHADSWVDIAGYAALGAELAT